MQPRRGVLGRENPRILDEVVEMDYLIHDVPGRDTRDQRLLYQVFIPKTVRGDGCADDRDVDLAVVQPRELFPRRRLDECDVHAGSAYGEVAQRAEKNG
jgi:hypothetical protein